MLSRRSKYSLLILALLTHSIWAQISFNSPLSKGSTCSTTVVTEGLRLDCTGKGFITADSLLASPVNTEMYVTILSANVPVGIGLGQRLDPNCLSSMLPETGTTWYDCQSCDKFHCYYNQVTTYSTNSDPSLINSASPGIGVKIGQRYNWVITPPASSGQCWQIAIAMNNPDGSFPSTTINPSFVCNKWYSFATNIVYAFYFELEAAGTASFLIQTKSCTSLSNCMSCPDPSTCQYCKSGFQLVSGSCMACDVSCATCTGSGANQCKSCQTAGQVAVSGTCQPCSSNQYPDYTTQTCKACDSSCATCSVGGPSGCKTCKAPGKIPVSGTCQACAPNQYPDYTTQTCKPCHASCATCSGADSDVCTSCKAIGQVAVSGTCQPCNSNQYADYPTQTCLACDTSCATCSGSGPNACKSCATAGQAPVSGTCQACTSTQYPDSTSQSCQPCHSSCYSCSGSGPNACKSCAKAREVAISGVCVPCDTNQYPDYATQTCNPCDTTCATCSRNGPSACLTCMDTGQVAIGGICQVCASNQYPDFNSQTCKACDPSCATCLGGGPDACTSCTVTGQVAIGGTCKLCPSEHYPDYNTQTCVKSKPLSIMDTSYKQWKIALIVLAIVGAIFAIIVGVRHHKQQPRTEKTRFGRIKNKKGPRIDTQLDSDRAIDIREDAKLKSEVQTVPTEPQESDSPTARFNY